MSGRLGALGSSFANHFGPTIEIFRAITATTTQNEQLASQATLRTQLGEAQEFAQQEQERGAADALAGRPLSPDETNRHYLRSRSTYAGQMHGRAMFDRWSSEVLQRAPTGANITELTAEWMRRNATPTGDSAFDFNAARVLSRGIDLATTRWRQEGVQQVREEGVVTVMDGITAAARAGTIEAADLPRHVEALRSVLPANQRAEAAAHLITRLAQSVGNTPEAITRMTTILDSPGSGGQGDQSFFERHPQAREVWERVTLQRSNQASTVAGATAWSAMRERIGEASTEEELGQLDLNARRLLNTPGVGGRGQYDAVQGAIRERRAFLVEQTVGINQVAAMSTQGAAVDPSVVRRHLGSYFASIGVSPTANPEQAGAIVGRLGVVDDVTEHAMTAALSSFGNTAAQIAAYRFWSAVAAGPAGPGVASSLIRSDEGRALFQALRSMDMGGSRAIEETLGRLAQGGAAEFHRVRQERTLSRITGEDSDTKARDTVDAEVTARLARVLGTRTWFGGNGGLRIDPSLATALRDASHVQMLANEVTRSGVSWRDSVGQALESASQRIDLVPGPDGTTTATLRRRAAGQHTDGQPIVPGSPIAFNPTTRQPEDTTARAQADLQGAVRVAPALFHGRVGLGRPSEAMPPAVYPVMNGRGGPVVFRAGQELDFFGERVGPPAPPETGAVTPLDMAEAQQGGAVPATEPRRRLSDDPETAARELFVAFGSNPRFVIVHSGGGVFTLGYRFGFAETRLTEREAGYRAPSRGPRWGGRDRAWIGREPPTLRPQWNAPPDQ